MNRPVKRFLFWTPRIVCILFALFLSLFSLDVFGVGLGFKDMLIAVVMHQLPAVIMIVVLAVAWRWEWDRGSRLSPRRPVPAELDSQEGAASPFLGSLARTP
jgi:hypothetical protein